VISHENLGFADADQADRAKLSLDAKRVHVIFTAREFSRIVPAMWQERLKNRSKDTWVDYLAVLERSSGRAQGFWHQNTGAGLLAWAAGLPAERVHIVTVPPSGAPPTLLWERFATAIGIDPASCDTDVPRSNESLGVTESAFLRHFNTRASEIGWDAYRAHVKHFLAPKVLAVRQDSTKLVIQPDEIDPLTERAHQLVDTIKAHGFDVVGDLADLAPPDRKGRSPAGHGRATDDVPAKDLLPVAIDAVVGLVEHAEELRLAGHGQGAATRQVHRELRETRRRLDELRAVNHRLHTRLDAAEARLEQSWLRRSAARFARRHRWAGRLRDVLLRRNRDGWRGKR
jgi:hypothetical protein